MTLVLPRKGYQFCLAILEAVRTTSRRRPGWLSDATAMACSRTGFTDILWADEKSHTNPKCTMVNVQASGADQYPLISHRFRDGDFLRKGFLVRFNRET